MTDGELAQSLHEMVEWEAGDPEALKLVNTNNGY